jgi:iron complex outermembrane receptor protein
LGQYARLCIFFREFTVATGRNFNKRAGAFGASLNMLTDSYSKEMEISNLGVLIPRKHTVKFSTGLIDDHFELAGRVSALKSDGYIDRAASDLKSYFLQGTYVGKTTLIKALAFGGTEKPISLGMD